MQATILPIQEHWKPAIGMFWIPLANWQVMQEPKISHLIPGKTIDSYYLLISRARIPSQIQKTEGKPLSALLQQPTITHFICVLKRQQPGTTTTNNKAKIHTLVACGGRGEGLARTVLKKKNH